MADETNPYFRGKLILQRQNEKFQNRMKEMVSTYRDFLILFDMEDDHYDGLDTALLEALVKAQVVLISIVR
jgi:hypothetical protein